MKVILIAGHATSGKSYLGKKIINLAHAQKIRALQTEYSKYIKLYAKEILGYDEKKDEKPRKFLQEIGSYIRDDLQDEHFFTRRMLEDFRVYANFYDLIVISDVRLIREIDDIKKEYDVITIKVINNHIENNLTLEEKKHITEKELEDYANFDFFIENESEEKLNSFVKIVMEEINKKGDK